MLIARPDDLPNFDDPPVVETVLSVQFETLVGLRNVHLGLLWDRFRANFPRSEERPPLDPVIEQFPEVPRARLGLQLQTFESPPVLRVWFLNEQGNEMIQVQADRFIKNWRKEGQGEQYPRYEKLKVSFERDFNVFLQFLGENQLQAPNVNQCEVTYVNHILSGEGWETLRDLDKVFNFWQSPSDKIPGNPEDLRLHARFVIPNEEEKPVGRLHVQIQPAFRTSDGKPMYVFHLTARGQMGQSFEFFDLGRRWIVKSFTALTAPKMHAIWKKTDKHGNT